MNYANNILSVTLILSHRVGKCNCHLIGFDACQDGIAFPDDEELAECRATGNPYWQKRYAGIMRLLDEIDDIEKVKN